MFAFCDIHSTSNDKVDGNFGWWRWPCTTQVPLRMSWSLIRHETSFSWDTMTGSVVMINATLLYLFSYTILLLEETPNEAISSKLYWLANQIHGMWTNKLSDDYWWRFKTRKQKCEWPAMTNKQTNNMLIGFLGTSLFVRVLKEAWAALSSSKPYTANHHSAGCSVYFPSFGPETASMLNDQFIWGRAKQISISDISNGLLHTI